MCVRLKAQCNASILPVTRTHRMCVGFLSCMAGGGGLGIVVTL